MSFYNILSTKFLVASVNTLLRRKFMANFENETTRLCQQCTDYGTKAAMWDVAWPCVIHFFLEILELLLPLQILFSWRPSSCIEINKLVMFKM